ncbi:unnamed protein product [Gordionus sp. m RMFG-2023]
MIKSNRNYILVSAEDRGLTTVTENWLLAYYSKYVDEPEVANDVESSIGLSYKSNRTGRSKEFKQSVRFLGSDYCIIPRLDIEDRDEPEDTPLLNSPIFPDDIVKEGIGQYPVPEIDYRFDEPSIKTPLPNEKISKSSKGWKKFTNRFDPHTNRKEFIKAEFVLLSCHAKVSHWTTRKMTKENSLDML